MYWSRGGQSINQPASLLLPLPSYRLHAKKKKQVRTGGSKRDKQKPALIRITMQGEKEKKT
jgi:hypothetical protein